MKIACLGAGVWGFCLARLLATKSEHTVTIWSREKELVETLNRTKTHPRLTKRPINENARFTTNLEETVATSDLIVEAVTSNGVRSVFEELHSYLPQVPIVLASKGIEQNTGLSLPEIVISIAGEAYRPFVTVLSGPSFADEVSRNLPTAVVCGCSSHDTAQRVVDAFATPTFRIYPNADIRGVAFGGALKNIVAIACGISDGLEMGTGAKAALMTRGLHEITRLARFQGCQAETLYGLSGMGDLFLTCSPQSRNYRFGVLLSKGKSAEEAKKEIGMVVEGAYTCISALQLSKPLNIAMPITEAVSAIITGSLTPQDAVSALMQRSIKEERL